MNRIFSALVFVTAFGFLVTLTGCATSGNKFNYENRTTLALGKTDASAYPDIFGKPFSIENKEDAGASYEQVKYVYVYASQALVHTRYLYLEFKNELLNAYSYYSSFEEDQTLVDPDKLLKLERGKSKKSEAISLFGEPDGKAECPSVADIYRARCLGGAEVWLWQGAYRRSTYGTLYAGVQAQRDEVFLVFDTEGRVVQMGSSKSD